MVRTIRGLLYEQGFTIGGARQKLSEAKKTETPVSVKKKDSDIVSQLCQELEELLTELS